MVVLCQRSTESVVDYAYESDVEEPNGLQVPRHSQIIVRGVVDGTLQ